LKQKSFLKTLKKEEFSQEHITCIAGSISCLGNVAVADRDVAFNQQINSLTPNDDVNELFLSSV
jgi:hypothetical protein